MFKGFACVSGWLLMLSAMSGCGEDGRKLGLCELCLSAEGFCVQGCCELSGDPVRLCQEYTAALCMRGQECGGDAGDLFFCGLDCQKLSPCEMMWLVAFPAERLACQDSLPQAPCDPSVEGVLVGATPACQSWKDLAQAAVDDSSCSHEEGGSSRIQRAGE